MSRISRFGLIAFLAATTAIPGCGGETPPAPTDSAPAATTPGPDAKPAPGYIPKGSKDDR